MNMANYTGITVCGSFKWLMVKAHAY